MMMTAAALAVLAMAQMMPATAMARPRPQAAPAPRGGLTYVRHEGRNLNAFVQDGPVAAHLVARDGADPRLIVAFPAGNSGVALWFSPTSGPVTWRLIGQPAPSIGTDAKGRPLRGMTATLALRTPVLAVKQAVLGNIRTIRDVEYGVIPPIAVQPLPRVEGRDIVWARNRIDGAPGYGLTLRLDKGVLADGAIHAAADGEIILRVTARTGDAPLTPFAPAALLGPTAGSDPAARASLRFLSYQEKFLAGSWRFDTYFGRDTLMSLRLLMPALRPVAVEAGLKAVIARLSPEGEAAHEEGLSEYALFERKTRGEPASDTPTLDYAMVDTSLMLAPVLGDYLATPEGAARARALLATPLAPVNAATPAGRAGDLLARNLRWIWLHTQPFAQRPLAANLIALKPGRMTGQWRDSEEGLGRGRYAYDVNAVFAPAALRAIADLCARGLLAPYLTQPGDAGICLGAAGRAAIWQEKAPALFDVHLDAAEARRRIAAYAASLKVDPAAAQAAIDAQGIGFHALSLLPDGKPVPIVNSDESFALLFGRPAPDALAATVETMMRPFPAGLMSSAGLLIANPAFAAPDVQARFGPTAYHGTVVWSWQQALLAAGLAHQLKRDDLPPALRARLKAAQATLWQAIAGTRPYANSELWSWTYDKGHYLPAAYGAQNGDADESNAAQLWSTVYLGIAQPR